VRLAHHGRRELKPGCYRLCGPLRFNLTFRLAGCEARLISEAESLSARFRGAKAER